MTVTRVLLVDDHAVVREGLRALLSATAHLSVAGEASSLAAALTLVENARPDVVLLDLTLPDARGTEAVSSIRRASPAVGIVVLSMHEGETHRNAALAAGADAYVVKGAGIDAIEAALREVGATPPPATERPTLTPRERQVLVAVAEGHSNRTIGELLGISPKTIETHRAHLMEKLGVRSVAGLVRAAVRWGYVSP